MKKIIKKFFIMKAILKYFTAIIFASSLCSIPCSAMKPFNMFRFSFSQIEDSLLTDPEILFDAYATDLAGYDTEISIPSGFTPRDLRPAKSYTSKLSGSPNFLSQTYPLGLEADNNEAMILFPHLFFDGGNATLRLGNEIEKEIRAVKRDRDLDVNHLVDIYDVRDRSGYANADTVAIYELTTDGTDALFSDRYPHCIGIYLRKSDHPALLLKLLLSDEGYANKNDYVSTLFEHINYGRNFTPLTFIERQLKGYYTDLAFPSTTNCPTKSHPIMDKLPAYNYFKE